MKKNKSIKLNYIYNVSYQIVTMLSPLVTAPYLARVLNPDSIGAYSYTASIVSYFLMFAALGTINYGNREISYLQTDRKERTKVFWEIELLSISSVLLCLFIYLIFAFAFQSQYRWLFLVQAFSILAIAMDISWLLQGMEEFGKIAGRNILFKIINIVFIFLAVKSEKDLLIYVAGMSVFEFIGNSSVWCFLPKLVDKPALKELHPFRHLKPTVALFMPTIASTIYINLDKTMLQQITGNITENGYYDQSFKIYKLVLSIVTALGAVMIPRIGKCFAENKTEELKKLVYSSYQFIWFLGFPLCFGLMGISQNFCLWFYGNGWEKVPYILMIQALLLPIIGISNVTGIQYLITTKRENLLTRSVVIGAVFNLILNLIFIPFFYSYGAAIASVISELFITVIQLWYVRKELSITKILSLSPKYLVASLIMLAIVLGLNFILPVGILPTIVMVTAGGLVYILLLLLMKDSLVLEGKEIVFSKLKIKH